MASASSPDAPGGAPEHAAPLNVPAYVIGGRIQRGQVLGGISAALRAELEEVMVSDGVPAWVCERVAERTQWLGPVEYGKPATGTEGQRRVSGVGGRTRDAGGSDGSTWEVAGELVEMVDGGGIEEVARRIQEFWYDLEEEVAKRWEEDAAKESQKGRQWRRRGKNGSGSEGEVEKDQEYERSEKTNGVTEKHDEDDDDERNSPKAIHTNCIMDAVEKAVCSLYYDRSVKHSADSLAVH